MDDAGKWIVAAGLLIAATGALLWIGARLGLGRLPGDVVIDRGNFVFAFPLATSIILSILLTIALNVAFRIWR